MPTVDNDIPDRPVSKNRAATLLGETRGAVDKAIESGQLRIIEWAGRELIPPSEIQRARKLRRGELLPAAE